MLDADNWLMALAEELALFVQVTDGEMNGLSWHASVHAKVEPRSVLRLLRVFECVEEGNGRQERAVVRLSSCQAQHAQWRVATRREV